MHNARSIIHKSVVTITAYQAWTRRLLIPDMNKDWCSFPDIRRSTHWNNSLVCNDLLILKKLCYLKSKRIFNTKLSRFWKYKLFILDLFLVFIKHAMRITIGEMPLLWPQMESWFKQMCFHLKLSFVDVVELLVDTGAQICLISETLLRVVGGTASRKNCTLQLLMDLVQVFWAWHTCMLL